MPGIFVIPFKIGGTPRPALQLVGNGVELMCHRCRGVQTWGTILVEAAMQLDRITVDPAQCSGRPCIRGMRFPVHQIVELVAAGNTPDDILADFPYLEREDIRQALAYAAWLTREEWVAV